MRATKAYIASLGTTGLLLAFSASLLVVVGTLLAFNAWPGAEIRDAVDSVMLDDDEDAPFRVAGPAQVALDAAPAAVAVAAAPAGTALDGGEVFPSGGTTGGAGTPGAPDETGGGTFENPGGGDEGGSGPISGAGGGDTPQETPIDTGRGTDQLADTTEQLTNSLGQQVSRADPQLGDQVSETGQALTGIVRDLPDVQLGQGRVQIGNLKLDGGGR